MLLKRLRRTIIILIFGTGLAVSLVGFNKNTIIHSIVEKSINDMIGKHGKATLQSCTIDFKKKQINVNHMDVAFKNGDTVSMDNVHYNLSKWTTIKPKSIVVDHVDFNTKNANPVTILGSLKAIHDYSTPVKINHGIIKTPSSKTQFYINTMSVEQSLDSMNHDSPHPWVNIQKIISKSNSKPSYIIEYGKKNHHYIRSQIFYDVDQIDGIWSFFPSHANGKNIKGHINLKKKNTLFVADCDAAYDDKDTNIPPSIFHAEWPMANNSHGVSFSINLNSIMDELVNTLSSIKVTDLMMNGKGDYDFITKALNWAGSIKASHCSMQYENQPLNIHKINTTIEWGEQFSDKPFQIKSKSLDWGSFTFENPVVYINKNKSLSLHHLNATFMGGTLFVQPDHKNDNNQFEARFDQLLLHEILARTNNDQINGSGIINGNMTFNVNPLIINELHLSSSQDTGVLNCKFDSETMLRKKSTDEEAALRILENFHFSIFDLKATPIHKKDAIMDVQIKLMGSNPTYLDAHPFEFKVNLQTTLDDIIPSVLKRIA
jgi:hypothetical protein